MKGMSSKYSHHCSLKLLGEGGVWKNDISTVIFFRQSLNTCKSLVISRPILLKHESRLCLQIISFWSASSVPELKTCRQPLHWLYMFLNFCPMFLSDSMLTCHSFQSSRMSMPSWYSSKHSKRLIHPGSQIVQTTWSKNCGLYKILIIAQMWSGIHYYSNFWRFVIRDTLLFQFLKVL
jgi:hypothetical protein